MGVCPVFFFITDLRARCVRFLRHKCGMVTKVKKNGVVVVAILRFIKIYEMGSFISFDA